jgi:hypothetical protein
MIKAIYKVEKENIEIKLTVYKSLPNDLSKYIISYVGKHNTILSQTILPHDDSKVLIDEKDMQSHLLIECKLFNENEEIFIFVRNGQLQQRQIIRSTVGAEYDFVDKKIQLRNNEGDNTKNKVLVVRHYIDKENGGYSFLRNINIEKNERSNSI